MGRARLASSLLAALCLQVAYVSATTSAGVGVQAEVLWNRKGGGCKPGRYGKQCKQCPPGYYSPDGSHCKRCDELLTTMRSGSTGPAECTVKGCPAGTFKPANSFECAPCEVGTYSLGGYPYPTKCEKCPDGRTTIGKGAYNKDQCVCEPGFGRVYGEADTCERCPVGTYNYGDAFDECKVCIPPKTTTHAGATSDKDCVCPSGAGSGIDCDQCPANMILLDEGLCGCLPGHGGSECDKCEPGFYSPGGSAEVPRPPCKPCGLYFTSPAGAVTAEYCQCKAGFGADEYDDRHCAVCPLGTFNPGLSADAAASVSIATTDKTRHLRPRASPCFECGAAHFGGSFTTFQVGSKSPADCMCNPGYGGIGCSICAKGTYSEGGKDALCQLCPNGGAGYITDEGATTPAACVCLPGYGTGESGFCGLCPANTFGPGGNKNQCEPCPAGTESAPGATCKEECVPVKTLCPAGTELYWDETYGNRGPRVKDCKCKPGYGSATGEGICVLCAVGTFSPGGNMEDCRPCDFGTTSAAGSTSQDSCRAVAQRCPIGQCAPDNAVSGKECHCYEGFGGGNTPDEACTICPAGTYSANKGTEKCLPCAAGYTSLEGATEEDECFLSNTCPAGTERDTAYNGQLTNSCVCKAGYGSSTGEPLCKQCPIGTYAEGGNLEDCLVCPFGTTSAAGSSSKHDCVTVAQACPVGQIAPPDAVSEAQCACKAGYGGGATPKDACFICAVGTWAPGNSTQPCVPCGFGYTGPEGAYKHEQCVKTNACPAGTEYDGEDYDDRSRPDGEHKPKGPFSTADCVCKAGYGSATGEPGGVCRRCPAGTFSDGGDMGDCKSCPFGFTSREGANSSRECEPVAQRCPIGQFAPDDAVSEKQCRCYEGFGGGNTPDEACTICPAGTYSANKGTEECLPCAAGYTSLEGATEEDECFLSNTCPAGTELDNTYNGTMAHHCVCKAGYGSSTGEPLCKQCPIGTYAEGGNLEDCLACPFGTTSAAGSSSKYDCVPIAQACPVGQIAPPDAVSEAQCVCKAGYGGGATPKDACSICAVGTWAPGNSTQPCVPCGFGYTGPEGAYKHEQCVETNACPAGTEYVGGIDDDRARLDYPKPKGPFSTADCVCKAGYGSATREPGGVCRRCPAGTFSDGGDMGDCKSCPFGFTSREGANSSRECEPVAQRCPIGQYSPHNAVSEKQCRCYEGFGGGSTPDEACIICPAGTYSANQGTEKCLPCAAGYTSLEGAKNQSECFAVDSCPAGTEIPADKVSEPLPSCVCRPGFGSCTGEGICSLCPVGTYSEGGSMEDCKPCQFGLTSAAGSNSSSQCVPVAQACPVGQIAPPDAVSEAQCACKAGYGGGATPKDACSICAVGTWAPGNSTQPCVPCGFGYTGPEGAYKLEQCVETNACPAGTEYVNGDHDDDRSRLDSPKPKGPFSTADCVCKAGYGSATGEPGGVCRRCPAGTFSDGGDRDGCKSCPFGLTSREGANSSRECEPVAQRCPIGQFAPKDAVSEKQCRCYEGFGGGSTPDEACTICPAGTYSANQGTEKCLPCQFGYTSLEGAKNRSECFAVDSCPAGTEVRANGAGCVCRPGFGSKTGQGICSLCPIGTYSEGGSMEDCKPCDFGLTSAAGASSKAQCVPVSQACPVGQIAPPGAVSAAQCVCIAGYGGGATPQHACSICRVGFWAPGTDTQPCIPCGWGYTSPEGSCSDDECIPANACPAGTEYYSTVTKAFSFEDCVCKPGFGSFTGKGVCHRCPAGTFSAGGTMESCESCGEGWTSDEGAVSRDDCFTYDDDAKADSYGGYGSDDDDGAYSSLQAREGSFRALDVDADIPLGAGGVNTRFVRPEPVKPSTPLPATRQLSPVTAVKPQPRRPVSPQQPRSVAVTRPTAPKPAPVVSRKSFTVTPPTAPKPAAVVAPRPVAVTRPTAPKPVTTLAPKPVAVTPPPAPQPAGSTTHKQPLAANTPSQQQARAQSRRLQML